MSGWLQTDSSISGQGRLRDAKWSRKTRRKSKKSQEEWDEKITVAPIEFEDQYYRGFIIKWSKQMCDRGSSVGTPGKLSLARITVTSPQFTSNLSSKWDLSSHLELKFLSADGLQFSQNLSSMATSVPYQIPKVVISYLFARWRGRASTGKDLRSENAQRGGGGEMAGGARTGTSNYLSPWVHGWVALHSESRWQF
ncbi:hypothetical protein B0H13DRAFT_1918928 [Mycena leptocephala]|nr:hypothetical protein B0H13DRAFT_1918928 [Mycena leptocephala]